jgi:hypothetical protein
MSSKIQKLIHDQTSYAKFFLIVHKSSDESAREQMALVFLFTDEKGFIRERFLDIAHVNDTTSAT